jgi:DNA-binding MarR family transcriptional regulator
MASRPARPSAAAIRAAQALRAFGPEYKRWVDSRMPGDAEITPGRLRVLAVLARRGPMTMVTLSRELGTTANNVTKLVDWLEAAGHLERRRDVHDRRAVELHLTDTGRDAEQRLAQAHADAVAEVFTDLPDEQLDQLTALLDRLRAAMRDRLA